MSLLELSGLIGGVIGMASLAGVLLIEYRARRRRRKREEAEGSAAAGKLADRLMPGRRREPCRPADAAQPVAVFCGCGWHAHEATEDLAVGTGVKHAGETGHRSLAVLVRRGGA